jgi:hypothetical protein
MGHFPDGRERHRVFSVKDIRPDADDAVVHAIGSLLAYHVTKALSKISIFSQHKKNKYSPDARNWRLPATVTPYAEAAL